MWKVLIADDEKKVCELIQYLVPWKQLNLEVVAIVENGIDAIEILKHTKIDIIITDARMPECDGLELIRWCHQENLQMKYIVISGYRHFEYAHSALQYGVDYYLLKPINQKELIDSLKHLTVSIEKENEHKEDIQELQKQQLLNRDKLRRHFINSYIFDGRKLLNRHINSVEAINEEYQMNFSDDIYRALFIKIDALNNSNYEIDIILNKIKEISETYLMNFGNEQISVLMHSGIIFILNYQNQDEENFFQKIEGLYTALEKNIDIFEVLKITIGISTCANQISDIQQCIITAGDAIRYRIILKQQNIIFYDRYQYDTISIGKIFTSLRKELFQTYLKNNNRNGIKKLIFDMRIDMKQRINVSPVVLYYLLDDVKNEALNVIKENVDELEESKNIFTIFSEKIDHSISSDDLWNNMEILLNDCMNILEKELKKKQTKPIRIIKEFVEEHYAEPISLELIADKVNLSVNYVSAVFRKETGVNFTDYLTAKRIEQAMDMLRKTDLPIKDIAERVGYTDVRYFSKLCKKTLGMKPTEYRKLYS